MASHNHLFSHCNDAVCVAEDASVSFYAPKTLKKFRVESFNGARICGIYVQNSSSKGNLLHVIDAEWNWFVISLKKIAMEHSTKLRLPSRMNWNTEGEKETVTSEQVTVKKKKEMVSALVAQFYEVRGSLYGVLLTSYGVYEVLLTDGGFNDDFSVLHEVNCIMVKGSHQKKLSSSNLLLAVGQFSGLIVVAEQGERHLKYSSFEDRMSVVPIVGVTERDSSRSSSYPFPPVLHERVLLLEASSLACSPTGEKVAVGGARGELAIYTTIRNTHHFSDHWHHTPLRAMCFSSDGSSLITGAQEDVLLVWSMSTYSHRKIHKVALGPIRSIVPSASVESTLLVASGFSTLSSVDLLQMTVAASVEGIEWSSGVSCTGCFFSQWMGQSVVVLTGLPHVLRLTDPLTQQTLHSLHLSSQMEVLPTSPCQGVVLAACLRDGKVIVTYETFGARTILPPQLCFWVYDTALREHQLVQAVHAPHDEELLALCVHDSPSSQSHASLFTLSSEMMKCWKEVETDRTDVLSFSMVESSSTSHLSAELPLKTEWRNQSASPTPSHLVQSMVLSNDGSICFVADDAVHLYDVQNCSPGVSWTRLKVLSQGLTRTPLNDLVVNEELKMVCARSDMDVFAWSLAEPILSSTSCYTFHSPSKISSLTNFNRDRLLICSDDCTLLEVQIISGASSSANTNRDLSVLHSHDSTTITPLHFKVLRRFDSSTSNPIQFMQQVPDQENLIGVVDGVSGFRVLRIEQSTVNEETLPDENNRDDRASTESRKLNQFFPSISSSNHLSSEKESSEVLILSGLGDSAQVNRWLQTVLQDAPYTAPPMSTVFSQYLEKCQGTFQPLNIH